MNQVQAQRRIEQNPRLTRDKDEDEGELYHSLTFSSGEPVFPGDKRGILEEWMQVSKRQNPES
jgi:hypothetical protein